MKHKVSTSALVNFACRTGDLVLDNPQGPTSLQGIRAHQKLQRAPGSNFSSEVSIKHTLDIDDDQLTVSGRIDLLDANACPPQIREIKTTLVAPSHISSGTTALHWAQLKIYGYCYLAQCAGSSLHPPNEVQLELLWFNLQDEKQTLESETWSFEALQNFACEAARLYLFWIRKLRHWQKLTKESAAALPFPYTEFRTGQRDMAAAIYRTARDGGHLLCEAPTGIGKTVSSLFPAIKAVAGGYLDKVIYLTAKTSGREVALQTLESMQEAGLVVTYLVIQSKVLVCHCSNGRCDRDSQGRCPLTLGFFDRLPQAREELMAAGALNAETLDKAATQHSLCPFELALQMLPWMSLVVCDYNYVFDPLVSLPAFSEANRKTLLLLDEAHNLVDRGRGMYSARLTTQQNRVVMQECQATHPELGRSLKVLGRALSNYTREQAESESVQTDAPRLILRAVNRCIESMANVPESSPPVAAQVGEWFKELYRYAAIDELYSAEHRTLGFRTGTGRRTDSEVSLKCLDASGFLNRRFALFRAAAGFSATLRPQEYYRRGIGMSEETRGMLLQSPFDPARLGVFVCPHIDTRFRQRDQSISKLVALIHAVFAAQPGNYIVFFPSYAYMEKVHEMFVHVWPAITPLIQQRGASADERVAFLQHFEQSCAVLGFAIMGGVFGEGIDYAGERLIGSIVVGTGLPSLGLEQKLIAQAHDAVGENGFDYTYRYPGFTRVLQTAGRVIRSDGDKGIVVLADSRFAESFYRNLFPQHWNVRQCSNLPALEQELGAFWNLQNQSDD